MMINIYLSGGDPIAILSTLKITPFSCYVISAFIFCGIIRLLLTISKTLNQVGACFNRSRYWRAFWKNLCGIDNFRIEQREYLSAFILGFIGLLSYPVLIASGHYKIVGFWIGLKTLAQWKTWVEVRVMYTRFLVGTALTIIFSVLLASWFIKLVPPIQ